MQQQMEYSEERGTWNLFVDGEWYAEGTYDLIEGMYENNRMCELEQYDEQYDEHYDEQ